MNIYGLKIQCDPQQEPAIRDLFASEPGAGNTGWILKLEENETDPYTDFIDIFLKCIDAKESRLLELGVEMSDISFWLLYEYDQQCNLEFAPQEMKRLGDKGIKLCVSCWQK